MIGKTKSKILLTQHLNLKIHSILKTKINKYCQSKPYLTQGRIILPILLFLYPLIPTKFKKKNLLRINLKLNKLNISLNHLKQKQYQLLLVMCMFPPEILNLFLPPQTSKNLKKFTNLMKMETLHFCKVKIFQIKTLEFSLI